MSQINPLDLSSSPIVTVPHPILRSKMPPVSDPTRFATTIAQMKEIVESLPALGLAAPQIGVMARIMVFRSEADGPVREAINPVLVLGPERDSDQERCLSLPDIVAEVERASSVILKAEDISGQAYELNLSGLAARIVQHETDHLDGILMTDRGRWQHITPHPSLEGEGGRL